MKSSGFIRCAFLLAYAAAVAAPAIRADVELPTRDSSKFDFKYEMDILPTTEDQDNDGKKDFAGGGAWLTADGGIAKLDMSASSSYIKSDASAGQDGGAWRTYAPSAADGYTIEVRMKVLSQNGTYGLALTVSDGSNLDSLLMFNAEYLSWGNSQNRLATFTTTNAFHTYRLARLPSENRFVVWVDGGVVTNVLDDALPNNNGLNRFLLGAIGSGYRSKAEVDYLRFTKGAYAPKPIEMDSADFPHKYEMDSLAEGFSPTSSTAAWTLNSGDAGTAELENGVLSVVQPKTKMRYWQTSGPMDDSAVKGSSFTFETRLKITDAWSASGNVLHFVVGVPGAAGSFFVNANAISWRDGQNNETFRFACNNTDKMHVLRVTYCVGRFTLWRDGEKLGEDLKLSSTIDDKNHVRFGIVSTSAGGSFDIDYIRWTTEGAFQPSSAKPGTTITFR